MIALEHEIAAGHEAIMKLKRKFPFFAHCNVFCQKFSSKKGSSTQKSDDSKAIRK